MGINATKFVINEHNPEFRSMMERIATAIRKNDSTAISAVRTDLEDAGLKISVSYLPDSDRIHLIVEGNQPLLFNVVDYLPVENTPDGEQAQPGDN
jgi:hypothetical protein